LIWLFESKLAWCGNHSCFADFVAPEEDVDEHLAIARQLVET